MIYGKPYSFVLILSILRVVIEEVDKQIYFMQKYAIIWDFCCIFALKMCQILLKMGFNISFTQFIEHLHRFFRICDSYN